MQQDEAARVRQSANTATGADILQDLAQDPSATVRATVALNPSAPALANTILASDRDERVRALLGRKLAALAPNLNDVAHQCLRQQTVETLTALVADEAARVRQSIAEAVKHMPDAPRDIILRLAHDPVVMVSEPVILFSPVLTSQDLVALIVAAPSAETIATVARRPGIDGRVSNAVVAAAHADAVAALLANPSAQIMEATLDALVARAETEVALQDPLVRRPILPAHVARALSEIVTTHLLAVLSARDDLDAGLARDLRDRLKQSTAAARPASADQTAQVVLAQATALRDVGQLNDAAFIAAARRGDSGLLCTMLAMKAGVALPVIERAAALRSAKGLIALAWKANLSMPVAQALQVVLGRLPPDAVIHARPGGGYPMTTHEMRWQLEFMYRTGR
ncbi:DUF2336 domain-containing protein [Rhodopila sp.]|uniref:DUF2336 domain-containing protein n=1 Tax=Rhodopila sp. TaxID=2480087 RepID=UPI003D10EA8E